jgi:Transposase DDE domain
MYNTRLDQAKASVGFVQQVETYVQRCLKRMEVKEESRGAGPDPKGPGRPLELPKVALWSGLLLCVLQGAREGREVWRYLVLHGYDICDQTLYDRVEQEGTAWLEQFFAQITTMLATWLKPLIEQQPWYPLASFATDVLALDETTLDPVARKLPILRLLKKGAVELLPGKLAGLYDVRLQLWRRIDYLPEAVQNCKVHAGAMLKGLAQGTLLLFDLGYFSFEWLDELSLSKYWFVCRLREKTSYTVLHTYYGFEEVFDGVVWLGNYQAQAGQALRMVRFRVGAITFTYLTNVLDPAKLPIQEIARLYARRWDIELAFLTLKEHLGLHLWWSSKVSVILVQVWACLILAQLLQAVRLEIACRAQVEPFEVSLPLLVKYVPQPWVVEQDPIAVCVQRGRQLGLIRPSSRTRVQGPRVEADQIQPLPPDVVLTRTPKYPHDPGQPGRKGSHKPSGQQSPPTWGPQGLTTAGYACLVA